MSEALLHPLSGITMQATSAGLAALGIVAALFLGQQSLVTNLERACTLDDTPYLELCPRIPNGEQRSAGLRSRIAGNPGDARAYVLLALADRPLPGPQVLNAA